MTSFFSSVFHRKRTTVSANLNQNKGFTIVEVIIVLAVGGLILLIVFEAIPALQRNGRNNQRKHDVSDILQAVSHYEVDNSANFPTSAATLMQYAPDNLSYYTNAQISLTPGPISPPPVTNVDVVNVYNYQICSTTTQGATTSQGADYSNIVALYALESGGGSVAECSQL